jgi:hypothetical protein
MRDLQVQVVEPEASRGGTVVEKRSISQWSIRPTRAIPAGQAVVLRFSYAGGEESGPRFYIGPEGSFASGKILVWYPRPAGVIRATGELQFSAPAGYTVVATNTSGPLPLRPSHGRFLFKVTWPGMISCATSKPERIGTCNGFTRNGSSGAAPEWKLTWKQEGEVMQVTVTQSPPHYCAAIEVQAEGHDYRRLARKVEVEGPKTEFAWPVRFRVASVTLDPHFQVLHSSPEYRAQAEALVPFTRAILAAVQGNLAQAHRDLRAALEQAPEPDQYGVRFHIGLGQAVLFKNEGKPAEARQHLEAALASPVRRADLLPNAYYYWRHWPRRQAIRPACAGPSIPRLRLKLNWARGPGGQTRPATYCHANNGTRSKERITRSAKTLIYGYLFSATPAWPLLSITCRPP